MAVQGPFKVAFGDVFPFGAFVKGGVEPVRFLVRNPYGLACLGGATVLLALGLAWVAVVRREATRSAWHQ